MREQDVIELPDKHPLRIRAERAEAQRDLLRAALAGLVGVDGHGDLEQMEAVMRVMPAPLEDKAKTIDAIHALLATLPPPPMVEATNGASDPELKTMIDVQHQTAEGMVMWAARALRAEELLRESQNSICRKWCRRRDKLLNSIDEAKNLAASEFQEAPK